MDIEGSVSFIRRLDLSWVGVQGTGLHIAFSTHRRPNFEAGEIYVYLGSFLVVVTVGINIVFPLTPFYV